MNMGGIVKSVTMRAFTPAEFAEILTKTPLRNLSNRRGRTCMHGGVAGVGG